jgi:hypothetical protein
MKPTRFAPSVVAIALATLCGASQAESVSFSGFSHGSKTVVVNLTSPPNTPAVVNKTVSAGGFDTVLNGGPSFETYCIDVYQTINFGAPPYTEYAFAGLHLFTNANAYTDLGRLYATAGVVDTAVEEAAFQIAVWEIAYEATGTAYDVGSGGASFSGGTAATSGALTLANTWLAGLAASGPTIQVLESRLHQDVIFATPVPEPETYALFMAGLAAVGVMSRRRKG